MRQIKLIFCLFIILTFVFTVGCGSQETDPRETEIVQLVAQQKYEEAIKKTKELYEGENDEIKEILEWITKNKNEDDAMDKKIRDAFSNPSDKLVVQEGWQYKIDGDYNYITGRVKNMTDSDISYFKLTAEYLDKNGNVLDSEYANDISTIKPGNMKEFEIMKKHDSQYDQVRIFVEEVRNN